MGDVGSGLPRLAAVLAQLHNSRSHDIEFEHQASTQKPGTRKKSDLKVSGMAVNGGGIMLHAERPDGSVAAAQKCAIHGPLSVATRGGGCTAWSSMRRFDWRLSTRV